MNPLISDAEVTFLLHRVFDAGRLCELPYFAEHSPETFDLFLQHARRLAREELFPRYRAMDEAPPEFAEGKVRVHPAMHDLWRRITELGVIAATRPEEVGGQQLPILVHTMGVAYLMAANLSVYGYAGLTHGAAHLIEAFGDEHTRSMFMSRMYAGEWTGTMALTEPHAGSSLSDATTRATPAADGSYRIRGAKIFISGGDHDLADNVVHLLLARIDDAPVGVKGLSLFAVPRDRPEGDALVPNDVHVAGMIHKIGWRGLPSLVMSYGDSDDCHGWLVGEAHRGIAHMFQMMNEARIMVGMNGVATASVAYQESLAYARTRVQGRRPGQKAPVAIIEHADVRRMLLRQKAIVEGGMCLLGRCAWLADMAAHGPEDERTAHQTLLDLLTPVAKSFPAERGFEANTLALQIHGGYGYSSEYLPEAWLRDQKLNSIHEGTTGIHGLDLLGRRVLAGQGVALRGFATAIDSTALRARAAGVESSWCDDLLAATQLVCTLTEALATRGQSDPEAMLLHSSDYLDLFCTVAIAWQWVEMAAAAREAGPGDDFTAGKLHAAQYWIRTELPRVDHLARLCLDGEDSYVHIPESSF